jgi:hypothetical protein
LRPEARGLSTARCRLSQTTADCRLPIADDSQDKNDMMFLLSDLRAGETSPAFVFQPILSPPELNA